MWRDKAKKKKVIKGEFQCADGQKSNKKITFQNINND